MCCSRLLGIAVACYIALNVCMCFCVCVSGYKSANPRASVYSWSGLSSPFLTKVPY